MIILLGAPGSGKSTQGQMLVDRGKVRWISMGEILRQNIKGKNLEHMKLGKLLDSNEVIQTLNEALQKLGDKPKLILDGFPRSVDHAKWLLNQKNQGKINISAMINLFVEESIVKQRLMNRGRLDDNLEVVTDRYKIYIDAIWPITELFKNNKIPVIQINASKTKIAIGRDIIKGLLDLNICV